MSVLLRAYVAGADDPLFGYRAKVVIGDLDLKALDAVKHEINSAGGFVFLSLLRLISFASPKT